MSTGVTASSSSISVFSLDISGIASTALLASTTSLCFSLAFMLSAYFNSPGVLFIRPARLYAITGAAGPNSANASRAMSRGRIFSPAINCPESSPPAPSAPWVNVSAAKILAALFVADLDIFFTTDVPTLPPIPPEIASNTAIGIPLFSPFSRARSMSSSSSNANAN